VVKVVAVACFALNLPHKLDCLEHQLSKHSPILLRLGHLFSERILLSLPKISHKPHLLVNKWLNNQSRNI
jgi:hypothetical protein